MLFSKINVEDHILLFMKYFEVFSATEIRGIIYLFNDRIMSMCN